MFGRWQNLRWYGTSFPIYRRSMLTQGAMSPDDIQALWRACLQITETERVPGDKVDLDVLMSYLEEMDQEDFGLYMFFSI